MNGKTNAVAIANDITIYNIPGVSSANLSNTSGLSMTSGVTYFNTTSKTTITGSNNSVLFKLKYYISGAGYYSNHRGVLTVTDTAVLELFGNVELPNGQYNVQYVGEGTGGKTSLGTAKVTSTDGVLTVNSYSKSLYINGGASASDTARIIAVNCWKT